MAEGGQSGPLIEELAELFDVERAVGQNGCHSDFYADAVLKELPGDDIGMMFHNRQYHFVAGGKALAKR